MAEESRTSRELRILGNIVFAVPRAVRWFGRSFLTGLRAGLASAQQERRPGGGPGPDRSG